MELHPFVDFSIEFLFNYVDGWDAHPWMATGGHSSVPGSFSRTTLKRANCNFNGRERESLGTRLSPATCSYILHLERAPYSFEHPCGLQTLEGHYPILQWHIYNNRIDPLNANT